MIKKLTLLLIILSAGQLLTGQTVEELQAEKDKKTAELTDLQGQLKELTGKVTALEGDVAGLTDKLTPYPRWETGAFGTVGINFAQFDNWLSKDAPSTSAATIGFSLNGFANLQQKKYFWRNGGNVNLSWLKFDDRSTSEDADTFRIAADAFNISSLFGYKITEKLAASALGEYRTSLLGGRFNDPGYLDLGVGVTWTPYKDLVVVIHPLNYNFIFSDSDFEFESSLGAKVVADYSRKLNKSVSWKSNFSAFLSYSDPGELSNWTWTNGFSTAYKGIGVGLEVGLRSNKQEALSLEKTDNPIQSYWILGLSYSL